MNVRGAQKHSPRRAPFLPSLLTTRNEPAERADEDGELGERNEGDESLDLHSGHLLP